MANDYFNHISNVIPEGIRALAAQVNNIANEIGTGLDKLPTEIQLKRGTTRFAVDTGAADAYVVALPYVPVLQDGLEVTFRAINANTGASTVNVNALGAKSIVYFDLTALTANAIVAGSMVTLRYSSTGDHFVMISQSGKVAAIGDANTLDGIDSTQFLRNDLANTASVNTGGNFLDITQAGAGGGVLVTHSGTNGVVVDVNGNNASRTDPIVRVTQDHASSSGHALQIIQDGTGRAITVANNSTTSTAPTVLLGAIALGNTGHILEIDASHGGTGIQVGVSGTGAGIAVSDNTGTAGQVLLDLTANNTSRTAAMLQIIQDHASSSARALSIRQDGTGDAVFIQANSTGRGLYAETNGGTGQAGFFYNGQNNAAVVLEVQQDGTTSTGHAFELRCDGTGNALNVSHNNAAGRAGRFYANVASRTVPVVEIINDNATGSGNALSIQQDQSAPHIVLSGANGEGIQFPATANLSTDANTLDDYEEGLHVATVTPETSGTVTLNGSGETLAYTKVGRMVTMQGSLVVSSVSSPVGTLAVDLPFTVSSLADNADRVFFPVYMSGLNTLADGIKLGESNDSNNAVDLFDADGTTIADSEWVAFSRININFSYLTDS